MNGKNMYERWLLDCVFRRGWSTLKCTNRMNEGIPSDEKIDPAVILADFDEIVSRVC